MTSGIGNPDWQRRYNFSAVPLFSATFSDGVTNDTAVMDTNGFQYLLVSVNTNNSGAFTRIQIIWEGTNDNLNQLGATDFVIGGAAFAVIKVPVMTRFYFIQTSNVGGTNNGNFKVIVYGTNADQENLLTQNTDVPLLWANPSILAGATDIETSNATYGGPAIVMVDDGGNNLWTATLQYYDWSTTSWKSFWRARGAAAGQTITQQVYLPYAPVRLQTTNNDTAVHTFILSLVAP